MIEYRVYTQAKGRKSAPKLNATDYDEDRAILRAGHLALSGLWVTVVKSEVPNPSRWD
jgi:hypothetical protein